MGNFSYINNIEDHKKRNKIIRNIPDYSKALDNDKITPSSLITKLKEADGEAYVQILNDETFSAINREVIGNLLLTLQSLPKMALTETLLQQDFSLFTDVQIAIDKICKERIFTYFRVTNDEMEQAMNDSNNPLYLFKISNKDLSYAEQMTTGHRVHRGVENLHTILFKALMSGQQDVLDLGTGAVFLRKKSITTQETTHPANVPIMRKNPLRQDKKSLFEYDIKKDKRYRENKLLFHLSITQNYKADDKQKFAGMNAAVQNYIRQSQDLHIIGIDRGERNLLYYSVIDMRGNIIEQNSLNIIKHADLETDYQDLLSQREEERKRNRQNWEVPEKIKDLKQGYLSQAVHQIATLILKYNAIIALEDLGQLFTTRGQKIEKAVYQQFEKRLVDKLCYLVDKKRKADEPGGILRAYQLANSPETQNDSNKQNGFIFYVPAWNTSKTDPVTGFVDLLHPKRMRVEDAQNFFSMFDDIRYNEDKNYFEFQTNLSKFEVTLRGSQMEWTICSEGTRIRKSRHQHYWSSQEIVLTDEFKRLFDDFKIGYHDENLQEHIIGQNSRKFFDSLTELLQLTLQMRNSDDKGNDYIISPVADSNGNFFDSRKYKDVLEKQGDNANVNQLAIPDNRIMPIDADANGAYNIARKGLCAVNMIKKSEEGTTIKPSITNIQWLTFAQEKPQLK